MIDGHVLLAEASRDTSPRVFQLCWLGNLLLTSMVISPQYVLLLLFLFVLFSSKVKYCIHY